MRVCFSREERTLDLNPCFRREEPAERPRPGSLPLTQNEQDLHEDVADARRAPGGAAAAAAALVPPPHHREAHVIGHGDGHVEGRQQDQPIPAGLEGAVVEEDEAGLLNGCHFVLRDRRLVPEHVLDWVIGGGQMSTPQLY